MDRFIQQMEREGRAIFKQYAKYRVKVPYGQKGQWRVEAFDTEMGLQYLRLVRDGRAPGIGRHSRLVHKHRGTVMSDTAPEIQDLPPQLDRLRGHVLITGLGLGMVIHILTTISPYKERVKSITVVEKEKHVVALSGPTYRSPTVRIINADAYQWVPPVGTPRFDSAWHDIWDDICSDNIPHFHIIKDHYRPFMRSRAPQYCWGEAWLRRH